MAAATATTTTVEHTNTAPATLSTAFTETITDGTSTAETGNAITGSYTQTQSETKTTTDVDVYDMGSSYPLPVDVTECSTTTLTETKVGNHISGNYALTEVSSGTYDMVEIEGWYPPWFSTTPGVGDFSLTETGSLTSTTVEYGNEIDSSYSQVVTLSDVYGMSEIGETSGGSFSETVNGSDAATLTEIGNYSNQTYNRTIVGTGTAVVTESGPGATLGSGSPSYAYVVTEDSDPRAGVLIQAETGSDRYDLLELWQNVANVGANEEGNMDYSPYGQPFADPGPTNGELGLPANTRLPSRNAADWTGAIGNSNFRPQRPQDFGLQAGDQVPFRNGRIDLAEFAVPVPSRGGSALARTFQVPGMGTGAGALHGPDRSAMVAELALRRGETQAATEAWLSNEGYRLHHAGGNRAQVVPGEIHDNIPHTGGRSDNARLRTTTVGALGALSVFLTLRDACQAAGVGRPDYVAVNAPYYFTDRDGSVFVVRVPGSLNFWSSPSVLYVAGPRAGQTQPITNAEVRLYQLDAEIRYGRYIPGGFFRSPRFIPGTERRTLPLYEGNREIGLIDEEGIHYYPWYDPYGSGGADSYYT